MTVSTKDRDKVGRTEYRVNVQTGPDESGNFEEHANASCDSEAIARNYSGTWLALYPDAYASVRRGTWVADEFEDDEYGTVFDAEFVEDENWFLDGWMRDGLVIWVGE